MNLTNAQPAGQAKVASLNGDTAQIASRLIEVHGRLCKIADALFGAIPRDASAKIDPPSPNNLQRHIGGAHDVITEIQAELARIETSL